MGVGFNVSMEEKGGKQIVRLEGRVDATSTPVLEKKLSELLEKGHKCLLIDFSQVDYLSSAGMRLLLSVTKKMKVRDGKAAFCGMSDEVLEIIRMGGFERILNIYPSEEEALAALE